jgi:hypothetical protein
VVLASGARLSAVEASPSALAQGTLGDGGGGDAVEKGVELVTWFRLTCRPALRWGDSRSATAPSRAEHGSSNISVHHCDGDLWATETVHDGDLHAMQATAPQFRTVSESLMIRSDLRVLERAERSAPHTETVLTGLENLVAVGGSVDVDGSLLRDLRGLEALQHIGGSLVIKSSPRLETLRGLHNLVYVGGQLAVQSLRGRFGSCGELSAMMGIVRTCAWHETCVVSGGGGGGERRRDDTGVDAYACKSTVLSAVMNAAPDNLRVTWELLRRRPELQLPLRRPRPPLTFFAPGDASWRALAMHVGMTERELYALPELDLILWNHMVTVRSLTALTSAPHSRCYMRIGSLTLAEVAQTLTGRHQPCSAGGADHYQYAQLGDPAHARGHRQSHALRQRAAALASVRTNILLALAHSPDQFHCRKGGLWLSLGRSRVGAVLAAPRTQTGCGRL